MIQKASPLHSSIYLFENKMKFLKNSKNILEKFLETDQFVKNLSLKLSRYH